MQDRHFSLRHCGVVSVKRSNATRVQVPSEQGRPFLPRKREVVVPFSGAGREFGGGTRVRLNAFQGGGVWFDLDSLRVKRIAAPQVRQMNRQLVLPK